jgi:hypothetical protein
MVRTITLPLPAGYSVTVTDLPDPDGVRVTVAGSGTEKVTIALTNPVTGPPCGPVKLAPGSDVELLCGSITARVAAGSPPVEIVLSDDTSLLVGAGEQATIAIRIIPLKWRLLTEAHSPVTNLASASVSVAQITCQASAPSDAIENVAVSASALQNLGNGYYQLNWKTDKSWRGCRVMRLRLRGEGPITHNARFKFN